MMEDGFPRPTDRKLRDLGAFVVLLTARPLLVWHNRGERRDGLPLTTLADLRNQARRHPRESSDFIEASMARTLAWVFVMVVCLVALVVTAYVRSWTNTWHHPIPVTLLTAFTVLSMFAGGALLVSSARWALAWWQEDRLEPELVEAGLAKRPSGLLTRLCTPSNGDVVFALLWSLCFTSELYTRIVDPQ